MEGIIPALETHAIACVVKFALRLAKDTIIVVNLSGREDKDIDYVARLLKI